jgi:hypothetical protein
MLDVFKFHNGSFLFMFIPHHYWQHSHFRSSPLIFVTFEYWTSQINVIGILVHNYINVLFSSCWVNDAPLGLLNDIVG